MPRLYTMTWEKSKCRWRKMHKGRVYVVSCSELGTPATKDDSYEAANQWWQAKHRELTGFEPRRDPASAAVQRIVDGLSLNGRPSAALERLAEQGEAARQVLAILGRAAGDHEPDGNGFVPIDDGDADVGASVLRDGATLPAGVVDAELSHGLTDKLPDGLRLELLAGLQAKLKSPAVSADPDRRIGKQVELWVGTERARMKAGKLGANRFAMNRLCLYHFRDWVGAEAGVEVITEAKWLEFHGWLAGRLEDGTWGVEHCDRVRAVAKRFVRFLYEMRLIELPRNLDNRGLSFKKAPQKIATFSVNEVQKLYAVVGGQSKLHVLLMLNCGFTGQDINDLRHAEVDWRRGTIRRKRSKTKGKANVPEVTYKLWPRTFALLKEHRSADPDVVLLTTKGNRWISDGLSAEGKYSRVDMVGRNLDYWLERAGVDRSPKELRATASTILGTHKTYKFYAQYFLGHAPKTMADQRYVTPNDAEFFEALAWLEGALGF